MPETANRPLETSDTTDTSEWAQPQRGTRQRKFRGAETSALTFAVVSFDQSAENEQNLGIDAPWSALRAAFERLRDEWKAQGAFASSVAEMAMANPYQRIIGMGDEVVPLILGELRDDLDHWFWALGAITGENPVSAESRGNLEAMRTDWLAWGRDSGLVDD